VSKTSHTQARRIANVEIRLEEMQVLVDGLRATLTVRVFDLLLRLSERHDRVMRRAEIYALVWGSEMPRRDRTVDVLIHRVRDKLERTTPGWRYIHTHFGIGYRFAPERRDV
jgi:DNA-binding response OmpR family regulator